MMHPVSKKIFHGLQRAVNYRCKQKLMREAELWQMMETFAGGSGMTERYHYFAKYWSLYHIIRTTKPKEVLECGMGITTLIIAYALTKNAKENAPGRLTSMENHAGYLENLRSLIPEKIRSVVDFQLHEKKEKMFYYLRGVGYASIPDRPYNFVFIDGPGTEAPSDGAYTFDFDFIDVVQKADHLVTAMIDGRKSTVVALQHIFGKGRIKRNRIKAISFVKPLKNTDIPSVGDMVERNI